MSRPVVAPVLAWMQASDEKFTAEDAEITEARNEDSLFLLCVPRDLCGEILSDLYAFCARSRYPLRAPSFTSLPLCLFSFSLRPLRSLRYDSEAHAI